MISFYFHHHYFHIQCNYYSKIAYSFKLIIIFLLLLKKCPDISSYSIYNYSFIIVLFFVSYFSSSVSKSVQISLIILPFNLSLIIFDFFPFTAVCLINQSYHFFNVPYFSSFLVLQTYPYDL